MYKDSTFQMSDLMIENFEKNKLKIVSILFVATYAQAPAVKTLNNSAKNLFLQHAKCI